MRSDRMAHDPELRIEFLIVKCIFPVGIVFRHEIDDGGALQCLSQLGQLSERLVEAIEAVEDLEPIVILRSRWIVRMQRFLVREVDAHRLVHIEVSEDSLGLLRKRSDVRKYLLEARTPALDVVEEEGEAIRAHVHDFLVIAKELTFLAIV